MITSTFYTIPNKYIPVPPFRVRNESNNPYYYFL